MTNEYEKEMYYLGDQMRKLRENVGISQEELADSMRISVSTLYRYESGRSSVPIDMLFRFSKALSVPISKVIPPEYEERCFIKSIVSEYSQLDCKKQNLVQEALHAMVKGLLFTQ